MMNLTNLEGKRGETSKALIFSCLLHGILLLALGISFTTKVISPKKSVQITKKESPVVPIKASVIDKKLLAQAIARQEKNEAKKRQELLQADAKAKNLIKEAKTAKNEAEAIRKEAAFNKEQAMKMQQEAIALKKQAENSRQEALKQKDMLEDLQRKLEQQKAEAIAAEKKKIAEEKEQREAKARLLQQDIAAARFEEALRSRVYENRVMSSLFEGGLKCKLRFRLLQDGQIEDLVLLRSSGNNAYDAMAEAALLKALPFPMPVDPELLKRVSDIVTVEFNDDMLS